MLGVGRTSSCLIDEIWMDFGGRLGGSWMVAEGIFKGPAGTKVRKAKFRFCEEQMANLASLGGCQLGLSCVANQQSVALGQSGAKIRR